ncbi:MAG: hypothetical protein IPG53_21530 [Ignavibacteriales bacterium]|nr:hypothetical protein [Ignavibacteriales bacterium]
MGLYPALPLITFSMLRDFKIVGFPGDEFAMMGVITLVQFVVGWKFYVGAYNSLRYGVANMDVDNDGFVGSLFFKLFCRF